MILTNIYVSASSLLYLGAMSGDNIQISWMPSNPTSHLHNECSQTIIYDTTIMYNIGYTESHYRGLVKLHKKFKSSPKGFNILAFPCNRK